MATASIRSSSRPPRPRMTGPMAFPMNEASDPTPTAAANQLAGAPSPRNHRAIWNNTNPCDARNTHIATQATPISALPPSASAASGPSPPAAISRGSPRANHAAAAKNTVPYAKLPEGPMRNCRTPAGITATAPVTPAIRPSFEFASTSSESLPTTAGTRACLDTSYVLCRTNAQNTSGKRATSSVKPIITIWTMRRPSPVRRTMRRRPPRTRSIRRPINGATTKKGANDTSKNPSSRVRAPSRSTSKKNESARATTIDA